MSEHRYDLFNFDKCHDCRLCVCTRDPFATGDNWYSEADCGASDDSDCPLCDDMFTRAKELSADPVIFMEAVTDMDKTTAESMMFVLDRDPQEVCRIIKDAVNKYSIVVAKIQIKQLR